MEDKEDKKVWFKAFSSRLWVPVSIEGWLVTVASFSTLYLIPRINNISAHAPFILSQHWPMLVEFAIAIGALSFVCKGHVDKRY